MISKRVQWAAVVAASSLAVACGSSEPTATPSSDSGTTPFDSGIGALDGGGTDVGADSLAPPTDSGVTDGASDGAAPPVETKTTVLEISKTTTDRFFGVAFDKSGAFYATGVMAEAPGTDADLAMIVTKFKADGTLDTTFGTNGVAKKNVIAKKGGEVARGIVVQSTGKIVIAGTVEHAGATDDRDRDIALVRFDGSGKVDETFGDKGVLILDLSPGEVSGTAYVADGHWGLDIFPDDALLVTGAAKAKTRTDTDFAVMKVKKDGGLDETFGDKGVAMLDIDNLAANGRAGHVLPDGTVIASGYMRDKDSIVRPVVFKLKADGKLDDTFATKGVFNEALLPSALEVYDFGFQGTNLVTVGYGKGAAAESNDILSIRLSAAGVQDKTYGTGGIARVDVASQNENGRHILVLPDQRVMILGGGRPTATNVDGLVVLLTKDGKADTSWGPSGFKLFDFGGPNDHIWAGAIAPARDRIVLVGLKGVDPAGTGNDDAVVVTMPIPK